MDSLICYLSEILQALDANVHGRLGEDDALVGPHDVSGGVRGLDLEEDVLGGPVEDVDAADGASLGVAGLSEDHVDGVDDDTLLPLVIHY